MAQPTDPYRTLGLNPGASADEVRRAYRRLAKVYHPDSAGETALPRFLAIQAAYEMLLPSKAVRRSPAGTPGPAAGARPRPTRDGYARPRPTGASGPSSSRRGSGTSTGSRPAGPEPPRPHGARTGTPPRTPRRNQRPRPGGGQTAPRKKGRP